MSEHKYYLITYRAEHDGVTTHGQDITTDPIEWLARMQIADETYFLLNAQPITLKQVFKYRCKFKGWSTHKGVCE